MKRLLFCIIIFSFGIVVTGVAAEFKIDADFPGANAVVTKIDGNTVQLRSRQNGYYWSFRIRGAEGRTLNFEIVDTYDPMSDRGPAVSNDGGITWRWLNHDTGYSPKFQYVFGPEEKEVLISSVINYTERDLKRFLEKYKDNPHLKIDTLCQSEKGRNVELLRIPGKRTGKEADFKVALTTRHHACETSPAFILEGIMEVVLSESDDGKWLRNHCDFFIVPFVDKDSVELGDHGWTGMPHLPYNCNRDYIARLRPEVRAITEQIPAWQNGKPLFFLDMHNTVLADTPTVYGQPFHIVPGRENNLNRSAYFCNTYNRTEENWKMLRKWGQILEAKRKGPIPYKESFNLPFGESWNSIQFNFAACVGEEAKEMPSHAWAMGLSNVAFAGLLELHHTTNSGVETNAESLRLFGHDMARAIRIYLETLEK